MANLARTFRGLSNSMLACVVLVSAFAASGGASELRTYQIASDQQPMFRYSGGLTDFIRFAQLVGSFDVEIGNDGSATLTRFGVRAIDPLQEDVISNSWVGGASLADYLFVNPIGKSVLLDPSSQPVATEPVLSGAYTTILLTTETANTARLTIASRPESYRDNPSFSTDSPGFLVHLVPEPSACSIALVAFLAATASPRYPRKRGLAQMTAR